MNKEELIKVGLLKKSKEIDLTWDEIAFKYTSGKTGEQVRNIVKKWQKKNGTLSGKYDSGKTKILIFNDLHIPDHQENMILDIVKQNNFVDLIILNGDILDCKAASSWYDEEISILDHEMIKAHELLLKIRKLTDAKIILVKGNHEERVNTAYAKNAKSLGATVVETEILYKLANGFTVKYIKQNKRVVYEPIPNVHYCEGRAYVIGDLVVNHPSTFSKDYMKTVFTMYNDRLKNKYPNGRVFLIGHTHQLGKVFINNGVVLIENGCTCLPARYADKDDRPFKIQQYGYTYLEMKNGKVDIDSIVVKYLDSDEIFD